MIGNFIIKSKTVKIIMIYKKTVNIFLGNVLSMLRVAGPERTNAQIFRRLCK